MISSVLDKLVEIQSGLRITSPIEAETTKAYKYVPEPSMELPGRCWLNEYTLVGLDWQSGPFQVAYRMQFYSGPSGSDVERQHSIATAFLEAFIRALYPVNDPVALVAQQSLNGACFRSSLRGGTPTVGILNRGGKGYVGAEVYLDVFFADYMDP